MNWAIMLCAALALPAAAQELKPDELVRKVTDDVLAALRNDPQLASGDRQRMLQLAEEKVLPYVDFREAVRLAVGRAWREASAEQRDQLAGEFRRMLVRTYANSLRAYEGQTLKVMPLRMKDGDTDVTVQNQYLRAGAAPVKVDYQMHKTAAGWKIYDIVVEGISLVLTYRSEFDAVVKQSGIDGLIKRLAEKNVPPKAG